VRDVIANKLRFPPEKLKEISFCNIHRLPSRKDAAQSNGTSSTKANPIVVKIKKWETSARFWKLLV